MKLMLPCLPAPHAGPSEYVQGLTLEEAGTLLNADAGNEAIMAEIFDTAFAIKVGAGCGCPAAQRLHGGQRKGGAGSRQAVLTPVPHPTLQERIYGNRIVLFAPLYLANYCVNNCRYCAFRAPNKSLAVRWGGVWMGASGWGKEWVGEMGGEGGGRVSVSVCVLGWGRDHRTASCRAIQLRLLTHTLSHV